MGDDNTIRPKLFDPSIANQATSIGQGVVADKTKVKTSSIPGDPTVKTTDISEPHLPPDPSKNTLNTETDGRRATLNGISPTNTGSGSHKVDPFASLLGQMGTGLSDIPPAILRVLKLDCKPELKDRAAKAGGNIFDAVTKGISAASNAEKEILQKVVNAESRFVSNAADKLTGFFDKWLNKLDASTPSQQ